jgi:hypothetical protein
MPTVHSAEDRTEHGHTQRPRPTMIGNRLHEHECPVRPMNAHPCREFVGHLTSNTARTAGERRIKPASTASAKVCERLDNGALRVDNVAFHVSVQFDQMTAGCDPRRIATVSALQRGMPPRFHRTTVRRVTPVRRATSDTLNCNAANSNLVDMFSSFSSHDPCGRMNEGVHV